MRNSCKCIGHTNVRDPILGAKGTNENGEIFKCKNEEEIVL